MDIGVVFCLGLMKLLWTFMYKSEHGHVPLCFLSTYLEMGWLGYMVGICLTFKKLPTISQTDCTIFTFLSVLVPHLTSIWYGQSFVCVCVFVWLEPLLFQK